MVSTKTAGWRCTRMAASRPRGVMYLGGSAMESGRLLISPLGARVTSAIPRMAALSWRKSTSSEAGERATNLGKTNRVDGSDRQGTTPHTAHLGQLHGSERSAMTATMTNSALLLGHTRTGASRFFLDNWKKWKGRASKEAADAQGPIT